MSLAKTVIKNIKRINESLNKVNESSNGATNLINKYFSKDDAEEFLQNGEDDFVLNSKYFPASAILEFGDILDQVGTGLTLATDPDDEYWRGPKFGTEFQIIGNNRNYITGYYTKGKIAFGVGSPAQTAFLDLYSK